jgi:hypothetical protein
VTLPDNGGQVLKLDQIADGRYALDFVTSLAGVYQFRVMAQGLTELGSSWTREKTLTAGVYRNRSGRGTADGSDDRGSLLCNWLRCILEPDGVVSDETWKRLLEFGIDPRKLVDCIEKKCPETPKEQIPKLTQESAKSMNTTKTAKPQTVAEVKFKKAVAPKPIPKQKPKKKPAVDIKQVREPTFHTMFMPLDLYKEEDPRDRGKGRHSPSRRKKR